MTVITLVQHVSGRAAAPGGIGIIEIKAQPRCRIARIAAFDGRTMRRSLIGLALMLALSCVALTEAKAAAQAAAPLSPVTAPAALTLATAPASQAVSPSVDEALDVHTYDISEIVKDPYYLIYSPRKPTTGPGGFSMRIPSDNAPSTLPAGDSQELKRPQATRNAPKQTPEEKAELRHRAALALVELVREKMLSVHANSPEATAYWRKPGVTQLRPIPPEAGLEQDNAMTVTANPADHDRIRSLLTDLREDSKIKISVQCRFIELPIPQAKRGIQSWFKRSDKDPQKVLELLPKEALESATLQPDGHSHRVGINSVFLDDKQLEQLLKGVEVDCRSVILTAPRVALRNNREARVEVHTDTSYMADLKKVTDGAGEVKFEPRMDHVPTGHWFHISVIASRDRKNVQVKLQSNSMRLVSLVDVWDDEARANIQMPVTWQCGFEETVVIPADRTQVLVSQELADDPRDTKGSKQRHILLVTPRIIAAEDDQNQYGDTIPISLAAQRPPGNVGPWPASQEWWFQDFRIT